MILALDIGGTKVNLALFDRRGEKLVAVKEARYESRRASGIHDIIDDFFRDGMPRLQAAGVGVAGPVKDQRAALTNLPWTVTAEEISRRLGGQPVVLLNDLAATAAALPYLAEADVALVQAGEPEAGGRRAVLSAGTGLGGAFLIPALGRFLVLDGEPGQADFAPRNERERALAKSLGEALGRVSVEAVVSGAGLYRIYRHLAPDAAEVPEMDEGEGGRVVSELGLAGGSAACREALLMFVSIFGAVAGNLALTMLPRGGLYLGGGMAPRLLPLFEEGGFIDAFCAKGDFASLLAGIPVRVILNEKAPLLGAAHFALGEAFLR